MIDSKNYIGIDRDGYTRIFQKVENGTIKGFNGYDVIETVRGTRGLQNFQWTHRATINGVEYKTGDKPAPTQELPPDLDGLYEMETYTCEEPEFYYHVSIRVKE